MGTSMHRWVSRFELKPERWVFIPTENTIKIGIEIKTAIMERWTPPYNYYHLQKGGHVSSLRDHIDNTYFACLDIENFFGSINKSRVTRCLKTFFSYEVARKFAVASTVVDPNGCDPKKFILPFGFVQSSLVSSVCLYESTLGRKIKQINNRKDSVHVSVYVDDIVISAKSEDLVMSAMIEIKDSADKSRFKLNVDKEFGPSNNVTVFNIKLSNRTLEVEQDRLLQFRQKFKSSSEKNVRSGIIGYINSINSDQAELIQID